MTMPDVKLVEALDEVAGALQVGLGICSLRHEELFLNAIRSLPLLRSALSSASGWRPIEEAPKDGTYIIVHGGLAHWHDGCWTTLTGYEYPGRRIEWPVTHFQPLSAPPQPEDIP